MINVNGYIATVVANLLVLAVWNPGESLEDVNPDSDVKVRSARAEAADMVADKDRHATSGNAPNALLAREAKASTKSPADRNAESHGVGPNESIVDAERDRVAVDLDPADVGVKVESLAQLKLDPKLGSGTQ